MDPVCVYIYHILHVCIHPWIFLRHRQSITAITRAPNQPSTFLVAFHLVLLIHSRVWIEIRMYIYIYTYMETPFYLHISIVRACTLYSYTIYIMMAWVMANPPFLCNIYIYIQIHDRLHQPLWFHVSVEAPRCFPHVPRKRPIAMWPVMWKNLI